MEAQRHKLWPVKGSLLCIQPEPRVSVELQFGMEVLTELQLLNRNIN